MSDNRSGQLDEVADMAEDVFIGWQELQLKIVHVNNALRYDNAFDFMIIINGVFFSSKKCALYFKKFSFVFVVDLNASKPLKYWKKCDKS